MATPDLLEGDAGVEEALDHLQHEDVTEAVEALAARAGRRPDAGLDQPGAGPVVAAGGTCCGRPCRRPDRGTRAHRGCPRRRRREHPERVQRHGRLSGAILTRVRLQSYLWVPGSPRGKVEEHSPTVTCPCPSVGLNAPPRVTDRLRPLLGLAVRPAEGSGASVRSTALCRAIIDSPRSLGEILGLTSGGGVAGPCMWPGDQTDHVRLALAEVRSMTQVPRARPPSAVAGRGHDLQLGGAVERTSARGPNCSSSSRKPSSTAARVRALGDRAHRPGSWRSARGEGVIEVTSELTPCSNRCSLMTLSGQRSRRRAARTSACRRRRACTCDIPPGCAPG